MTKTYKHINPLGGGWTLLGEGFGLHRPGRGPLGHPWPQRLGQEHRGAHGVGRLGALVKRMERWI